MTTPTSKAEFKEFCLRKLGKPVIEINVDDDQVDDRIDESIRYYWDYHFDGSEKIYYKHQITANNMTGAISEVTVVNAGSAYSNTDTVVFAANGSGTGAAATLVTNANGAVTAVNVTNYGTSQYNLPPSVSITTSTGSGAVLQAYNGGYITLPENIIGVVKLFSIGDPSVRSDDMFSIRYQIALNDLYTLTSYSIVPYYMTMQHLALISEVLIGQTPIRYNRHMNRLYIDTKWSNYNAGEYLLVEAYQVVDPNIYTDAWSDRWLQNYTTQKIKQQWGANLSKFTGMQLPGGVQFNGEKLYNDATTEIAKMEAEMIDSYSLPVSDMVG